jgi:hypothetical protein
MRALFRWVREGPKSLQSTGIVVQEGKLYAGQKALLAASEDAWWPLWQNPVAPKWNRVNSPRRTTGWLPQPFTGHELWWLCWGVAPGKAPGHDGWQVRRMRQWPLAVWELVAQLLATVEAAGRWPRQLRQGVVCLLPKAGVQATTCTPLEARPVVLLSMIYRMWARKRGREIGLWLVQNGMEGLPGLSRSAEDYGTLLTAEFERAEVLGEPVLAVCVDQSKAASQRPAKGQPKASQRPAKGQPKPAKGQPKASQRPAKGQPKASQRPAKGQPKATQRPAKGQPKAQPKASQRPAKGQPKASQRPAKTKGPAH